MSARICLLALIGLPATGKTSFSNWLLALPQRPFNVIHLCYDDRLQLIAEERPESAGHDYKNQRNKIISIIEMLIDALKNKAKLPNNLEKFVKSSLNDYNHDFLLICDDNNYYRSMRYKLYQISKQNECAYAQIHFNGILKLAMERNDARPPAQRVSQETMQRMAERLEIPDPTTQRWETNTLLLTECEDYDNLRTNILEFLSNTFENKLKSKPVKIYDTTNLQSLVHQLDLLLRRRIGEILQAKHINVAERQNQAKILCAKRKTILHDVKAKAEKENMSVDDLNEFVNLLD